MRQASPLLLQSMLEAHTRIRLTSCLMQRELLPRTILFPERSDRQEALLLKPQVKCKCVMVGVQVWKLLGKRLAKGLGVEELGRIWLQLTTEKAD